METKTDEAQVKNKTFRFNFSDDIYNLLVRFVKLHEYDDRKDYKEAWTEWYKEQDFTREYIKLQELGYTGNKEDFEKKLYTSARYYIPKRLEKLRLETNNEKKTKRRDYINIDYELLNNINEHIENNIKKTDYKPSDGFDDFCEKYKEEILIETNRLIEDKVNKKLIPNLIKKAYKNKYNQFIN